MYYLKPPLDLAEEVVPAVVPGVKYARGLDLRPESRDDVLHLGLREQLGDVTGGQEVVDQDEEALVRYLRV